MTAKKMFQNYVVNTNDNKKWVKSINDNPPTYVVYEDGYGYRHRKYTLIFENNNLKIIQKGFFNIEETYDINDIFNLKKFDNEFKECIIKQMKELGWI